MTTTQVNPGKLLKNILNLPTHRDKWVKEWPGQTCITASSMQWTGDTERALKRAKEKGDKKPLRLLKRKYVQVLNKFSEAIRGNLTKLARLKVVALVTIQVMKCEEKNLVKFF